MPTCSICRLGTICVHAWEREREALAAAIARVTAERDAARVGSERLHAALVEVGQERDAALVEVEAMQAVVDVAIRAVSASSEEMRAIIIDDDMVDALDALRVRKVGG